MSAEPVPAVTAELLRCHECDERVAAQVRHAFGEQVYLAVDTHPNHYDLVVVNARDQGLVRDLAPSEIPPKEKRRSRHFCVPHPHACDAAKSHTDSRACGRPARLYPIGKRCERHRR